MSRWRAVSAPDRKTVVSIAAMLALVVVSLVYMNSLGLRVAEGRDTRTAAMTVPHTNGLVVGSKVLLRGVTIGRVTAVEPSVSGVRIAWDYRDRYQIPVDSEFRVDNLSALGETYLGIIPRTDHGPRLSDGVVLTASSVTVPTTVDELANRVTRFLEQINSKRVAAIVDEVNTGLVADQQILSRIAEASALLETTVLTTRGSLTELLTQVQPLLGRGADVADDLAASGDPVERFGVGLAKFLSEGGKRAATSADGQDGFIVATNAPFSLDDQAKPLLENIQRFLDAASPDLRVLGDAALPAVAAGAAGLRAVDLSVLTRTALATVGDGNGLVIGVGP
ncbi:MlaD family protein [Gordonia sp. NPDC003376]